MIRSPPLRFVLPQPGRKVFISDSRAPRVPRPDLGRSIPVAMCVDRSLPVHPLGVRSWLRSAPMKRKVLTTDPTNDLVRRLVQVEDVADAHERPELRGDILALAVLSAEAH